MLKKINLICCNNLCLSLMIIFACSKLPQNELRSQDADGVLDHGKRIIVIDKAPVKDTFKVYRGDALSFQIAKTICNRCSIPSIAGANYFDSSENRTIQFTAQDTGSFELLTDNNKRFSVLKIYEFKARGKVKNVSAREASEILKDTSIFILDVRTPFEFSEGHISKAKLISVAELADKITEIEEYKNRPVFVYCRSGNRSIVAVQILTKNGFTDIIHLKGGIKNWINEKLPLEK